MMFIGGDCDGVGKRAMGIIEKENNEIGKVDDL